MPGLVNKQSGRVNLVTRHGAKIKTRQGIRPRGLRDIRESRSSSIWSRWVSVVCTLIIRRVDEFATPRLPARAGSRPKSTERRCRRDELSESELG